MHSPPKIRIDCWCISNLFDLLKVNLVVLSGMLIHFSCRHCVSKILVFFYLYFRLQNKITVLLVCSDFKNGIFFCLPIIFFYSLKCVSHNLFCILNVVCFFNIIIYLLILALMCRVHIFKEHFFVSSLAILTRCCFPNRKKVIKPFSLYCYYYNNLHSIGEYFQFFSSWLNRFFFLPSLNYFHIKPFRIFPIWR